MKTPNYSALVAKFVGKGVTMGKEVVPRDATERQIQTIKYAARGLSPRGKEIKPPKP